MILKMSVKSKFVLCKPRYYNYLLKKSIKKIRFLKDSFFEDVSLDDTLWGNFTLSNSNVLVGRPSNVKWRF